MNTGAAFFTLLLLIGIFLLILVAIRNWWHRPVTDRLEQIHQKLQEKPAIPDLRTL